MAKRLNVCRDGQPIYEIVMEHSFAGLSREIEKLGIQERRICIVTDSNVGPLYLKEVEAILRGEQYPSNVTLRAAAYLRLDQ